MKNAIIFFVLVSVIGNAESNIKSKADKSHISPYSEAAQSIVVGAEYQHYKGPWYKILAVARHSETLEEEVVYQALYGQHHIWVRPLAMFLENVFSEGVWQPRFKMAQNNDI
ncbi:MAG: DUF1653 domain-containing protein [Myxococcaceae bacterium]